MTGRRTSLIAAGLIALLVQSWLAQPLALRLIQLAYAEPEFALCLAHGGDGDGPVRSTPKAPPAHRHDQCSQCPASSAPVLAATAPSLAVPAIQVVQSDPVEPIAPPSSGVSAYSSRAPPSEA